MRKKVLVAILMAASLLAACGKNEEMKIQTIEPEKVEEVVAQVQETSEQTDPAEASGPDVITDREIIDGKMQSYLTGEWKDLDVAKRRSMAVMIPNNKAALPQYGISQASVIYEAPVEGRITRLMGIFEDYDDLKRIGPVRSARDYYLYEAMAFDSIYVNWDLRFHLWHQ